MIVFSNEDRQMIGYLIHKLSEILKYVLMDERLERLKVLHFCLKKERNL